MFLAIFPSPEVSAVVLVLENLPNQEGTLNKKQPNMKLSFIFLATVVVTFLCGIADAGPAAYAVCQASAATGCALTAVLFPVCYAAAQSACAVALVLPTP